MAVNSRLVAHFKYYPKYQNEKESFFTFNIATLACTLTMSLDII